MNIFISHSSQDSWATAGLMELIREINPAVDIFCSSEAVIKPGDNYKDTIFEQIKESDLFIALISENYWKSKYSVIELGAAYAQRNYNTLEAARILPLVFPPLEIKMAMANTPLVEIEVIDVTEPASVSAMLKNVQKDPAVSLSHGVQIKIVEFCSDVHRKILEKQSILKDSFTDVYFDETAEHPVSKGKVIRRYEKEGKIHVEYDFDDLPYTPNFASLAVQYEDCLNIREYLRFDTAAMFVFTVHNYNTDPFSIAIEFKIGDAPSIVKRTFSYTVPEGETEIRIPIGEMNFDWAEKISQICFVIHPIELSRKNGTFSVEAFHVQMDSSNLLF